MLNVKLWEARTRIFAWYLGLSAILVGLSIPVFTQLAILQVDQRVREDLKEELDAFEKFSQEDSDQDIKLIFDRFLQYKIPADKTFLIATINGKFYRSSPISLPQAISGDSSLITDLAQTTSPIRGKNLVIDPQVGDIIYKAEPIKTDGHSQGVLIVANIAQGERKEVISAMIIAIEVLVITFFLALILAWKVAGTVLKPVRTLINTANIISDKDLTQRIPVRGQGEMAELAQTFNNMMNRLEVAFRSQRQLLNDASHELRTPITIVRGHLELLEYDDSQEVAETIPLVLDELDRMSRLIEDLLVLARSERRDFLILKSVDLDDFTRKMYRKMQGLGERQWQLDSTGEGTIKIDRDRIVQAMMNLAHNAVKYTTSKDTIALGSSIDEKHIYFWIRDTGIGIPLEDQKKIFCRFVRSSNNQNTTKGIGLGLSIVSAIARSHNGRVELFSQVDKGSTFKIILPKNPEP
ncbi:signal transduction histidine kinase [Xenococcus sp. PCC 7305]|uniref:sensor histidine kinase n=1 Tax=Xenococcus sp. PCC 7305 TaxID=102125 RepID=UPI0002ABDCA0|nr:HAMP domain-containing sensor histidine kinase [Xenococcus sp. PCC 7305]ELS03719.1 signal transduction histidine kinase [Xenococcus sp. PCC 7305]